MKVHELARELGLTSKELIERLEGMKVPVRNHMSVLDDAVVERERLDALADRERRVKTLRSWLDALGRSPDPERHAISKALRDALDRMEKSRVPARFDAIWEAAVPWVWAAKDWIDTRDQLVAQAEQAAKTRRAEEANDRVVRRRARAAGTQVTIDFLQAGTDVTALGERPPTTLEAIPMAIEAFVGQIAGLRSPSRPVQHPSRRRTRGWRCACGSVYPTEQVCGQCGSKTEWC